MMARPPRDPAEPLMTRAHWLHMAVLGTAHALAVLGAFATALFWLRLPRAEAVTVGFVTLALAQLWNVFNVRDPDSRPWSNAITRNPWIWGALALCLGLLALALWFAPLAGLLGIARPGPDGFALATAASLLPLLPGQLWFPLRRAVANRPTGRPRASG